VTPAPGPGPEPSHPTTAESVDAALERMQADTSVPSQVPLDRIPTKLKGVRQAMGEKDWNHYIILMRLFVRGEITEQQMDEEGEKLFQMHDPESKRKLRLWINRMVVDVWGITDSD
jgi:hypothetical protein